MCGSGAYIWPGDSEHGKGSDETAVWLTDGATEDPIVGFSLLLTIKNTAAWHWEMKTISNDLVIINYVRKVNNTNICGDVKN